METKTARPGTTSALPNERLRTVVAVVAASTISLVIWALVVVLNVH